MLLDLHNHTRYSPDSRVDPAALVELARKIRLAGIAIRITIPSAASPRPSKRRAATSW